MEYLENTGYDDLWSFMWKNKSSSFAKEGLLLLDQKEI